MSVTDFPTKPRSSRPAEPANAPPTVFDEIKAAEARNAAMARIALEGVIGDLRDAAERCADIAHIASLPHGQRDLLRRAGLRIIEDLKLATALGARGG
jgi:hypothetical protein